ncbi:TPA: ATP--dephospho-CoA triphosphoribosyl transferase CitG [Candidatus Bathyarchaeota archaeon]|nr:ATP--dephospho-CoA triphosphoribosyl transferase CitG [Candidatus Bathyarchaeota archaeon]
MPLKLKELIEHVRISAQLAAVLEVSGWPKPGNVHRTKDHSDARYEHFLAGSIALGSSIGEAARKGSMVAQDRLRISEIGVGKLVKKAVRTVAESHKGGNTHLGICLLFVPLAAAAAKTYVENGGILLNPLRRNVDEIMRSTTPMDAAEVYKAITLVSSPRGLGKVESNGTPDLYDKQARRKLLEEGISLFDVMEESSSYDTVARELVTGMEVSFKIGHTELIETFKRTCDINMATVHTFLRILSKVPDTFIARKIGLKKISNVKKAVEIGLNETRWISKMAERCLNLGGLTTREGSALLWEFDRKLQSLGKDYSPGTTADLTATALMIALLSGLKF